MRHMQHWVNDTHSALNRTCISRLIEPRTVDDVVRAIQRGRVQGTPLAIAGGRHAMGGQQFLTDVSLLDMRRLNRVRSLDGEHG
jgi:FAD/FMN-containing dehydrogenase